MLGISLAGCSAATQVYVLNQDEVILLNQGDALTAPYDGTFYSARAEKRIMNARKITTDLK